MKRRLKIKSIECPSGNSSADKCPWKKRSGSIHDFPDYGVEERSNCQLVKHQRDLKEFIDEQSGSMHSWAAEGVYENQSKLFVENLISRIPISRMA